jgi:hypothetical protein
VPVAFGLWSISPLNLPSDVTLLLLLALLLLFLIKYSRINKHSKKILADKEKSEVWNLRVMARDPWRLALGGPRILARRTFWDSKTTLAPSSSSTTITIIIIISY